MLLPFNHLASTEKIKTKLGEKNNNNNLGYHKTNNTTTKQKIKIIKHKKVYKITTQNKPRQIITQV